MDAETAFSVAEIIAQAIRETRETKTNFANQVEISNANAKGTKQITVKGSSDGSLEELIKKVNEQYEALAK